MFGAGNRNEKMRTNRMPNRGRFSAILAPRSEPRLPAKAVQSGFLGPNKKRASSGDSALEEQVLSLEEEARWGTCPIRWQRSEPHRGRVHRELGLCGRGGEHTQLEGFQIPVPATHSPLCVTHSK